MLTWIESGFNSMVWPHSWQHFSATLPKAVGQPSTPFSAQLSSARLATGAGQQIHIESVSISIKLCLLDLVHDLINYFYQTQTMMKAPPILVSFGTRSAKLRSRVAADDLTLLKRMGTTAMSVHAKQRSRVAADGLTLLKRMGTTAITMMATLGQRFAAAWPVTRGAVVSDPNGTWTTQWYLRELVRDLVCTYLAHVLLPTETASSASLHHVCKWT